MHAFNRVLPSRWVMSDDACLAHFYYAFWIAFLRNSYHRVFGPCHCPPKFINGLCGHSARCLSPMPSGSRICIGTPQRGQGSPSPEITIGFRLFISARFSTQPCNLVSH